MYSFRENCEINHIIWHAVPRFNPQLFTISVKWRVLLQCRSEMADCCWPGCMVSICLIRKCKYDLFLVEGLLRDWLIFLLYLLQSVCSKKFSGKTANFSILNIFLRFLYLFVLKYFRIFVNIMRSKFHCLPKFSTQGTQKGILLILLCSVLLAWFSMLEISSI